MSRTIRRNRKTGKPERDSYHRNTHQDPTCRHGGSCGSCAGNRTFSRSPTLRDELAAAS